MLTTIPLLLILLFFLANDLVKNNKIKSLNNEIRIKDMEIQNKNNIIRHLSMNAYISKQIINERSNVNVTNDMVEAVKYAMKKAHPDNGGNQELFIKFRKVYEEMVK